MDGEGAAYYPRCVLILSQEEEKLLHIEFVKPDDTDYAKVFEVLVDFIEKTGTAPSVIQARDERLYACLRTAGKDLGVKVRKIRRMPVADTIIAGLEKSFLSE